MSCVSQKRHFAKWKHLFPYNQRMGYMIYNTKFTNEKKTCTDHMKFEYLLGHTFHETQESPNLLL